MKLINPEISVIIPVFKAKNTLARAINSINKQNINNDKIEIILSVDDNLSYYEFKELHNYPVNYSFCVIQIIRVKR